jgi:hypothetical protein
MSSILAAVIDHAITVAGGLLASLVGYRLLGPRPGKNPGYDAFHHRWGRHLRWIGPLVIVIGLLLIGRVVLWR